MAADDQSTAQDQFSCRRDDSERKHHRLDRPSDDHGGSENKELAEEFLEYMIEAQTQKR